LHLQIVSNFSKLLHTLPISYVREYNGEPTFQALSWRLSWRP